ncbi:MAG: glucose-6-phosphate isomerase [Candidatus Kapaibacterium sp.]
MKSISVNNLNISAENSFPFISESELNSLKKETERCYNDLVNLSGKGNEFLGWIDLPSDIQKGELKTIEETARYLRRKSDVIVVVGIGGSYLGARAVIEALQHSFKYILKKKDSLPHVVFSGQNISEDYLSDLMEVLEGKKFSVIVISKSGTTTEPAIAFRLLKNLAEKKFGKEVAANRIVAITDKAKGALKRLADKEGYKTFVIPDDVGGRFSVLSPVGLLPVACGGFNVKDLIKGAEDMETILKGKEKFEDNPAMLYAAIRNLLYRKGKTTEILTSFSPSLYCFIEWWKQLYGESEGKDGKGIFPAGTIFSTDLHSMGQYIQDGTRNIFETNIWVKKAGKKLLIPKDEMNLDELNYIAGKNINFVNEKAMLGTMQAHKDGGVPAITIEIPALNEKVLGGLIYFFEFACAISGYMLGVNPFDQPGVEAYKKNMFKLLGK